MDLSERDIHYIDVDMQQENWINEPVVIQNDSVTFVLRVTNDGESYPLDWAVTHTLVTKVPKSGVTSAMSLGSVTADNELTVHLGSSEVKYVGKARSMVQLYGTDGRVSSLEFTFEIKEDIGEGYVPSEDDKTLIQLVLGDGPRILAEAEQATVDAIVATEETNRVKAETEQERLATENVRKNTETERLATASERDATEAVRLATESVRQATEQERLDTKAEREATAQVKATTEAVKVATEEERLLTQAERLSTESIRTSTEQVKSETESVKDATDVVRQNTESERQSTESVRLAAKTATDDANVAAQYANEQGQRAGAAADVIEEILEEGPVVSVNGQKGVVELTAEDVGAETPSESKAKADAAFLQSKEYTDQKISGIPEPTPPEATNISIADPENLFDSTNVEGALAEIEKKNIAHTSKDATNAHTPKNVGLGKVINELQATHTDVFGNNVGTIQTVKPGNDFSIFGSYGMVFQPKQTINLKSVYINAREDSSGFKIMLSEWYEDLTIMLDEEEAIYEKEFETVAGYNKYNLDFVIPADGKKYFLWLPGNAPDLTRVGGFSPPTNPYVEFLTAGRAYETDGAGVRQTLSNWYWFFDWEVETSVMQLVNSLSKKKEGEDGKREATGTVTSSSDSLRFEYLGSTSIYTRPYVQVTGLGFEPSFIVVTQQSTGTTGYLTVYSKEHPLNYYYPGPQIMINYISSSSTSGTQRTFKAVSPAEVTSNGFLLPVQLSNTEYSWTAI